MRKTRFSKKDELEAEIRNKLTMPLTVLNRFVSGKRVSLKSVEIAIRDLEEILKMLSGCEWKDSNKEERENGY